MYFIVQVCVFFFFFSGATCHFAASDPSLCQQVEDRVDGDADGDEEARFSAAQPLGNSKAGDVGREREREPLFFFS